MNENDGEENNGDEGDRGLALRATIAGGVLIAILLVVGVLYGLTAPRTPRLDGYHRVYANYGELELSGYSGLSFMTYKVPEAPAQGRFLLKTRDGVTRFEDITPETIERWAKSQPDTLGTLTRYEDVEAMSRMTRFVGAFTVIRFRDGKLETFHARCEDGAFAVGRSEDGFFAPLPMSLVTMKHALGEPRELTSRRPPLIP